MAQKGPSMDLSSFQDIMTCILGILILIILLTGIDASQIVMLVATPRQATDNDKRPVFFECRNNQLFRIDPDKIKDICDKKTSEIFERVGGNEDEFLKTAAQTYITVDGQRLDFASTLAHRYVLYPVPDAQGYTFAERYRDETDDMWYGQQLKQFDPERQFICFFVRPDSFTVFQKARSLAWLRDFNIACELQQPRNPIILGDMSGEVVLPQ